LADGRHLEKIEKCSINNKNSPGDEIANVNILVILRQYRTHTSKYQKENLLRLTN